MSKLNFQQNKLFLEQFVAPSSLINTERINQIFETAQAYNGSSMEDLFVSYQNMKDVFDPFFRDAEKDRSIFTERCIVAPVKKIYDYIRDDFENNDAIRATTVAISPLDRKYPLHVIGKKVELKFQVENQGPGYALDVQIECIDVDKGLKLCIPIVNLGILAPRQSSDIVFEIAIEDKIQGILGIIGQISWRNFDNSRQSSDFDFELPPQRTDLNWKDLESKQPYSLEAVNEAEDLVGRTRLMGQLNARLSANRIESSIIHGQKRVGKTSIAEVVQANFMKLTNYSVIFVPINGLDTTTPDRFVADLGKTIVDEVSDTFASFRHIETPQFESALAPLRDYFRDAKTISPDHKFIIILDEFDEIHPGMVQIDSGVGQTFFNNIRAISSTGHVGFALVGGENMQIIRESTDQLNRMTSFRVDYFNKEQYWSDFQDLVRQPTKNTIEFNDEAINALYEMTEGHPFYTKAICSEIYTTACEERSAHISEDNVEKAVQMTIESLDLNAVSHFWIDGISKRHLPARRDEIQTQCRKFLIAFAQIKRRKTSVNREDLQKSEILRTVDVDQIIDNYRNRGFLIEENIHEENIYYRWKPKFFERWLIESGFSMLTGEFLDEEAITHLREEEEKAYVTDTDILDLCSQWGLYRGSEITPIHVRAWIEQFEYKTEQRLMFNLLKHVRFYDQPQIRERFHGLHRMVQEDVAKRGGISTWDGRTRRNDILLSSFGSLAQSGSSYTRIYAHENKITVHNVANFDNIPEVLQKNNHIKAIVFVDDIIASGESAVGALDKLNNMCGELIRDKQVRVFISAICGLHIGIEKLENAIKNVLFDAEIIVSDFLIQTDQCFSDQSEVFSSSSERDRDKQIALEYGKKLKQRPLGYKDSQLLVAFHDNCPNNTLPILWKELTGKVKWTPLFKRN